MTESIDTGYDSGVSTWMDMQATFTPAWDPVPAKAFTPQQAFLSLKSTASGRLVVVAAKAGKDGAYTVSLTPEAIATQIGPEVGCYFQACWHPQHM